MLRFRVGVGIVGCLAGCGTAAPGQGPDAGGEESVGLVLEFRARPDLPDDGVVGNTDHGEVITHVSLQVTDVRAAGEAAAGDDATYAPQIMLSWQETNDQLLRFEHAPRGRYSKLLAEVASYEISGALAANGQPGAFVITDAPPGGLKIDLKIEDFFLEAGTQGTIRIDVDLRKSVREMDWSYMEDTMDPRCMDARCYLVDENSEKIDDVREKLVEGFKIRD